MGLCGLPSTDCFWSCLSTSLQANLPCSENTWSSKIKRSTNGQTSRGPQLYKPSLWLESGDAMEPRSARQHVCWCCASSFVRLAFGLFDLCPWDLVIFSALCGFKHYISKHPLIILGYVSVFHCIRVQPGPQPWSTSGEGIGMLNGDSTN